MKLSSAVILGTAYGQLDINDLERKSKRDNKKNWYGLII